MMSTDMTALSAPISNLTTYTRIVESYPRLTPNQEQDLAIRFRENDDHGAAKKLILSHLWYVLYIARGYSGYSLPADDIVQEGNVGLMKAVKRFDPNRGVRLATYAAHYIRAEIHEYILKNWRIIKFTTTKAKRKLFYKLRSAKPKLDWLRLNDAKEIAETLNVSCDDVLHMDAQMYVKDQPFNASPTDSEGWAPEDYLCDCSPSPENQVCDKQFMELSSNALSEALENLDDRSRFIIESRWLLDDDKKTTLKELADHYQVSKERIRQIEAAAILKLKKMIAENFEHN